MRRSRFTDAQKMAILAEHGEGVTTSDICRRHGISPATFYNWKSARGTGETGSGQLSSTDTGAGHISNGDIEIRIRMRILEEENVRLKRLLADAMLENLALRDRAT